MGSLKRANLVTTSEDKPERGVISTAGSSSTVFGLLLFCECGFPPGSPVSTLITIQSSQLENEKMWFFPGTTPVSTKTEIFNLFSFAKDVVFPPGQLRFSTKHIIFLSTIFEVNEKIWFFLRVNSGFPSTFYLNL